MPWTRKQVKLMLSDASPLSGAQQDKMKAELHADPSMGHAKKRSAALQRVKKTQSSPKYPDVHMYGRRRPS